MSGVPSLLALSTTSTRSGGRSCAPTAARHPLSSSRRSRVTTMAHTWPTGGHSRLGGVPRPPVDVVVPFRGDLDELAGVQRNLARLRLTDGDSLVVVDNTPGREPGAGGPPPARRGARDPRLRPQPGRRAGQRRLDRVPRRRRGPGPRPARPLLRPPARRAHRAAGRRRARRGGAARRARLGPLRLPAPGDGPGEHLQLRRVGLRPDRERRRSGARRSSRRAAFASSCARARTPT